MFSMSSMKCVFMVRRRQCQGNIWKATECPTYMMVAFIPTKIYRVVKKFHVLFIENGTRDEGEVTHIIHPH